MAHSKKACFVVAVILVLCFKATMYAADGGRLPMLPNDEAWRKLPGASAQTQPLPGWARMLAGPMHIIARAIAFRLCYAASCVG
jgi:hypothetical protein